MVSMIPIGKKSHTAFAIIPKRNELEIDYVYNTEFINVWQFFGFIDPDFLPNNLNMDFTCKKTMFFAKSWSKM